MKKLALSFLLVSAALAAPPSEPVGLEGGISPTKRHEVVLEADKDTPTYRSYEFKEDSGPKILIRELPGKRVVAKLLWPGDPNSDAQPLRTHTAVLWSPDGECVAINTSERHYAHSSVFARDPESGKFVEVEVPDYKTMTGFAPPDSDKLRARGFANALSWTPEGHLVYILRLSPGGLYEGKDPLVHRTTLRVTPKGMVVVRREANPKGV
jgi:hypothetical protein